MINEWETIFNTKCIHGVLRWKYCEKCDLEKRVEHLPPVADVTMSKAVVIDYTNHRGERRNRRIQPTGRMAHHSNEWHTTPQWLLEARDLDIDAIRWFAMVDIHAWSSL